MELVFQDLGEGDSLFPSPKVALSIIPYLGGLALIFLFAIPGDNKANDYGAKVKK